MSSLGDLEFIHHGSYLSTKDEVLSEPSNNGSRHAMMGYIGDREPVIYIGKTRDCYGDLYLVVLTRLGVGVVHPSAL